VKTTLHLNRAENKGGVIILEDVIAVAKKAHDIIITTAEQAIAERGCFRIVFAGGSTPRHTYQLLRSAQTDWKNWFIYYGDERCLPSNDPERNSMMATKTLLNHVAVNHEQVYPIPTELGANEAAKHYREIIATAMPFDLVLLGMGEDGHTASLFPGQVHPTTEWVHAVCNAPKPPPERVSLSVSALSNTRKLLFLITGKNKREALFAWQKGEDLPVNQVVSLYHTDILLDREAGDFLCH